METLVLICAAVVIMFVLFRPLLTCHPQTKDEAKRVIRRNLCTFGVLCLVAILVPAALAAGSASAAGEATAAAGGSMSAGLGYIAAALSTGLAALGAGIAVGAAAPAAIGAFSEDPKNFGKSLIFVALGEGVAIYGLLISILILNNL